MITLSIESSAKSASVALTDGSSLLAQYFQNSGLTHSRTLLKMAEDMLSNLDMKVKDLELIAVASGPGSFTGIRIGVSAAIGLAWGANLPICGVSTLEAMAHPPEQPDCVICPVMDARRSQVYTASFAYTEGRLLRLSPDRALSLAELSAEASASGKPYLLVGDGAQLCYNAFSVTGGISCALAPIPLRYQTAWGVACASVNAPKTAASELKPNYLRASQAERERQEKQDKQTGS
jgi:tRNA threonylcarbamoyladenosine biosynthesis protein TsaB